MNKNRNIMKCSECKTEIYTNSYYRECYNCGAKMDIIGKEDKK